MRAVVCVQDLSSSGGGAAGSGSSSSQWSDLAARLQRVGLSAFVLLYPYLHASLEAVKFVYQLGYLLDVFETHSPVLQLLGQRLVRLTGPEMVSWGMLTATSKAGLGVADWLPFVAVLGDTCCQVGLRSWLLTAAVLCACYMFHAPSCRPVCWCGCTGSDGATQAAAAAAATGSRAAARQPACSTAAQAVGAWLQHGN